MDTQVRELTTGEPSSAANLPVVLSPPVPGERSPPCDPPMDTQVRELTTGEPSSAANPPVVLSPPVPGERSPPSDPPIF